MSTSKKLICTLAAGAALFAATPSFADGWRGHGRDHDRYSRYDRFDRYDRHGRFDHRHPVREFESRRVVVIERPVVIERQVQVYEPAPAADIGVGAMIGAVIGGIYDSRQ